MVEHLKNVQQELINTQQLIEAKTKEVGGIQMVLLEVYSEPFF